MSTIDKQPDRRKLLKSSLVLAAAPAVVGVPAYAQSKATVTWKVQAHWPKASSSFKDSLEWFAAELGKRTGGRFKMQLFGAGELAKGGEIYNIVKRGVVEMGTLAPAYILDEAEAMGLAYGIPGTFREPWQMAQYLKNMGGEQLVNDQLLPKGVIYRTEKAYSTELVVNKKINSLDDFKSLKLRSAGTLLDYLSLAGASPTHIAGPELYQALATGVVDGAHWGAAQSIDIVQRSHDIFGHPKRFVLGEISVHFRRRFRAGRVLMDHEHAIDPHFLDVTFHDPGGRNETN